jgi:hypothetical protein
MRILILELPGMCFKTNNEGAPNYKEKLWTAIGLPLETVAKKIPHIRKLVSLLSKPFPLCKNSLTNMSIIILVTASGL